MPFKHNCTKFYLLTNKPVLFIDKENKQSFEIKLPTLEALYSNEGLIYLIGFIQQDLNKVQKMINIEIKTHYEFIHFVYSLSVKNADFFTLREIFDQGFRFLNSGFHFDKVLFIDDVIITPQLFDQIVEVILLSLDKEVTRILTEDDEFTKAEKQAKIRAEQIRKNGKSKEDGTGIEEILAAILYEFQQYKLEDLMGLNLHQIYYLFKYVGKIANYEVSKIAAGSGLAKKHKYFIENN